MRATGLVLLSAIAACIPAARAPASPVTVASIEADAHAPTPVPEPNRLPPIVEETLPNGLRVLILPDHEIPAVTMTLLWAAGDEVDTPEKAGLATLAAALLRQGTRSRTAEAIAEEIDRVGGDLSGESAIDTTRLTLTVLSRDVAKGLDLLSDVAIRPVFPVRELEDLRRQAVAQVKQELDDPSSLAAKHGRALLFGKDHPYAVSATERSLRSIRREDLLLHYRTHLRPDNAYLAIAGDVDPAALAGPVRLAFGAWASPSPRGGPAAPTRTEAAPDPVARRIVRLVDKPDLTQSTIRISMPGIERSSSDYHAARLMNFVLGGGSFSSRLVRVVRADEGKTYGIGSGFRVHRRKGEMAISTTTRSAETVATLDLVLREIDRMRRAGSGVTPAELRLAQSNLIGSYPMQFETAADVVGKLLSARVFGLPLEEVTEQRRLLAAVTLEEVDAAAKRYLDPDRATIVVVGNASAIRAPLESRFGEIEVVHYLEAGE